MQTVKKRMNTESILFNTFNYMFMVLLAIVTLYPFLNTLAVSFNAGADTTRGGIYLWPRIWTLKNYEHWK